MKELLDVNAVIIGGGGGGAELVDIIGRGMTELMDWMSVAC